MHGTVINSRCSEFFKDFLNKVKYCFSIKLIKSNNQNLVILFLFFIRFDKDNCLSFFSTLILTSYQSFNEDKTLCGYCERT